MRSQRTRSRLFPRDLHLFAAKDDTRALGVNRRVHERQHVQQRYLYTSKSTLDLVAGAPWYPNHGGQITGVRLNVAGAPASTLTCDVLLNGNSIFPTSAKPTIATGALVGQLALSDIVAFNADDKLQVQLTATGSATGPLVASIEYREGL